MAHRLRICGNNDLNPQFVLTDDGNIKRVKILVRLPIRSSIPYFYRVEDMFGFSGTTEAFYSRVQTIAAPTSISGYVRFENLPGSIKASITRALLNPPAYYHSTSGRYFADIFMRQGANQNIQTAGANVWIPSMQQRLRTPLSFTWRS